MLVGFPDRRFFLPVSWLPYVLSEGKSGALKANHASPTAVNNPSLEFPSTGTHCTLVMMYMHRSQRNDVPLTPFILIKHTINTSEERFASAKVHVLQEY